MKDFDITAYIENSLEGAELEAFEKELQQNPDFAREVKLQQQLAEDIEMQGIRNAVSSALTEKDKGKGQFNGIIWGLGGLVALIIGLFFYFQNGPSKDIPGANLPAIQDAPEENTPPSSPEAPIIEEKTTTIPKKEEPSEEVEATGPIASAAELSPPLYPSPSLRGNQAENESWKALLDQLWYTEYPPADMQFGTPFEKIDTLLKERNFTQAYIRLQVLERKMAQNDTLRFLKGYCLLELSQGAEALSYWEGLDLRQASLKKHLEWYRGLAALISGQRTEAIEQFKTIAANARQPFQKQAKKALALLE